MKKIIQMLLIACLVVLGTQVAFANADKVTVQEGADLTAVHRLAIGSPLYMQVDPKSPNKDMLTQIVYESSRVARCYVISYDTIAQNIKADQNIDLKANAQRLSATSLTLEKLDATLAIVDALRKPRIDGNVQIDRAVIAGEPVSAIRLVSQGAAETSDGVEPVTS